MIFKQLNMLRWSLYYAGPIEIENKKKKKKKVLNEASLSGHINNPVA